jgi:hypothetical protein
MKKLRNLLTLLVVSICAVQSAWADDVIANVTLKEKNSLSTEILAIQGIDDVKTVTHLTVTTNEGVQLGAEDWTTIQSMSGLEVLYLNEASADAIPASQFNSHCPKLTTVSLPKDLTTIGDQAFANHQSIVTVTVPNTVTNIGSWAFSHCSNLENCNLSGCNLTTIPRYCFINCTKLNSFTIPSSVTAIGAGAFQDCSHFTSPLPTGLQSIGSQAFCNALMQDVDVVIPEGMIVPYQGFRDTQIRSIELPSTCYSGVDYCYDLCSNLQSVTLKSPTVVGTQYFVSSNASNITLKVPSHLVAAYKSHPQWSQYHDAVAISPAITDYTVSADLNLSNSSMRLEGTPNVFFTQDASLTIAGSTAQAFNNYTASAYINSDYTTSSTRKYSMIFNEEATVTVNGDFKQRFYVNDACWNFLCLPFDFVVSDVTTESGQFVIRTYDGARRNTENSSSGNWSANLADDAVITAGTGFILRTSEDTWVTFKVKAEGTNYAFKKNSDEIQIQLAANNSNGNASAANTGWNMVGNPWQTYYNIHNLNYTAPFAVYNGSNYVTYSPSDDDYALRPFEAVFVQCPNAVTSMDFPAVGRQLTSEITSQNAPMRRAAVNRLLLDIQVSGNEQNDKTRLVVNDGATMDYEIGRDASKFFADGTSVPQIYSLGTDGTQYAINERPAESGTLTLGILFASDGEYTLSAIRNDIGEIILKDSETGIKTDLSQHDYTFDANAGICNGRFTVAFGNTTGIQSTMNVETAEKEIYTLDGVKIGNDTTNLQKGFYVVRQGQHTQKVIIK